jgi:hypothetical protein
VAASKLWGVTPTGSELPCRPDVTRADRLLRAARPVLDRLANQLGGAAATVVLTDADARPAETRVTVSCDGATITVMPSTDSDLKPRAVITSSTDDFLAWLAKRLPWQQLVSVEGDRDEAARFLNALNLVQKGAGCSHQADTSLPPGSRTRKARPLERRTTMTAGDLETALKNRDEIELTTTSVLPGCPVSLASIIQ